MSQAMTFDLHCYLAVKFRILCIIFTCIYRLQINNSNVKVKQVALIIFFAGVCVCVCVWGGGGGGGGGILE